MHMSNKQGVILVTGATGNVGRHVVSQLLDTGAAVRALTREPASAGFPDSVEVVRGDPSHPDTLDGHLEGVEAVFLVWRSFTTEAVPAFLDAVAKHARRIVFLSSSAVRDDLELPPNIIARFHTDIERLIEKSGLEWTFLRPGGFATNTLWLAPQIRAGDAVQWPYGAAAIPLIHERDIATVAVRALTGEGHSGAKYVLTGPQALTQIEQVRTIGEAIGRPLRFEEISREAARQQMLARMSPSVVDIVLDAWERMVTTPGPITTTVEEITGAPARTFREWAIDHTGDFRASPSSLPNIARPDAGAILVSEWTVDTPERQAATIEAFVAAWERAPWPRGLLSVNLFASTDGTTVLLYAQWTGDDAYQEFVRNHRQSRADQIDRAVPGIKRSGPVNYRLYRSGVREGAPPPGCIVIVSVEFDGPDRQRQRQWVDTVFEALEAEAELHPGGISGHFHVSTDGTRVLNYAEWINEEAHRDALARSGQGAVGSGLKWRQVQNFPGMISNGYKRYKLGRSLARPRQANAA